MFKFKTIKTALLTKIGLVAIIPFLIISIFNYLYYRNDSIQSTAEIQSLVNQNTSTKIHLYLMLEQLWFLEFSKYSGVEFNPNENPQIVHEALTRFLKSLTQNTFFTHLFVCDKNGKILAYDSADGEPRDIIGEFIEDFTPVRNLNIGPYQSYEIGELKIMGQIASMPLIKSSQENPLFLVGISGLEAIKSFLNEELSILEKKNLKAGTLLFVDDRSNETVLNVTKQKIYPKGISWNTLNSENRVILYEKNKWYGDKEEIMIGSNRYHLITMVTKKDILFNSIRMLNVTLAIILIGLIGMGITVVMIANGFIRPLRNINTSLHKVAQGDLTSRIDVLSEDEFGQLSQSSNQMAAELQRQSEEIQRYIQQIKQEQERAEHLLLNILPFEIAEELKKEEKTIAQDFNTATILFSDLVGFTTFSSKLTAKELVEKLNALYSMFDDLLDKYHIEKIKTIGDALMLVSGVPSPRPDHAEEMAKMAFDMMDALKTFNEKYGQSLQIRIGIHSGPVVAGVIGKKKFVYDLWGDSVNIASRMESHGIPGCIQVSETTYSLLKTSFSLDSRGIISIKGKGDMNTYILKRSPSETWDRDYVKPHA